MEKSPDRFASNCLKNPSFFDWRSKSRLTDVLLYVDLNSSGFPLLSSGSSFVLSKDPV